MSCVFDRMMSFVPKPFFGGSPAPDKKIKFYGLAWDCGLALGLTRCGEGCSKEECCKDKEECCKG